MENEKDTFRIRVTLKGGSRNAAERQREVSWIVGKALREKAVYDRHRKIYRVGGWQIVGLQIESEYFQAEKLETALHALSLLEKKGYSPSGEILLSYRPPEYSEKLASHLLAHVQARRDLIEKALDTGGIGFSVTGQKEVECRLRLLSLRPEPLEAAALLMRQLCRYCSSIRCVRLTESRSRNEKYQMRIWLLRMGFIGEPYASARKTLLANLNGSSAFRTKTSEQQANLRRKASRLSESTQRKNKKEKNDGTENRDSRRGGTREQETEKKTTAGKAFQTGKSIV